MDTESSDLEQVHFKGTTPALKKLSIYSSQEIKPLTVDQMAENSFSTQIDPETTEFECFFHYSDEDIYKAGFLKGYKQALNK